MRASSQVLATGTHLKALGPRLGRGNQSLLRLLFAVEHADFTVVHSQDNVTFVGSDGTTLLRSSVIGLTASSSSRGFSDVLGDLERLKHCALVDVVGDDFVIVRRSDDSVLINSA